MSDQRGQSENQNMDRSEQLDSQQQEIMGTGNGSDNARNSNGRSTNRGFAAMSPERQKQIASEGGRAAHRQGVAHDFKAIEPMLFPFRHLHSCHYCSGRSLPAPPDELINCLDAAADHSFHVAFLCIFHPPPNAGLLSHIPG